MRISFFNALLCIGLFSGCGDMEDIDIFSSGPSTAEDEFGILDIGVVRQWSALWEMHQTGSIAFCISGTNDAQELRRVREDCRGAVNGWLQRLKRQAPDSSFPSWNRQNIDVRFTCSGNHWKVGMISGSRSWCNPTGQRIGLAHGVPARVMAHEFGHAMGLADTYNYQGGTIQGQPDSMMQSTSWSEDDYYGVWALWKWIVTGQYSCGPGYVHTDKGNFSTDRLCEPGDDTGGGSVTCRYECDDYGFTEGQCLQGWKCSDGCLNYVGECPSKPQCQYRCDDYGFAEGQCYQRWLCKNGCLRRVKKC